MSNIKSKEKVMIQAQEVQVLIRIYGDYVAFHEMDEAVLYDITNDLELDDSEVTSKEQAEKMVEEDDNTTAIVDALLFNDCYYT